MEKVPFKHIVDVKFFNAEMFSVTFITDGEIIKKLYTNTEEFVKDFNNKTISVELEGDLQ